MKKELKWAIVLAVIGGLLTTVAFVMAFTTAGVRTFGFVDTPGAVDTVYPLAPPDSQPTDGTLRYQRPWFSQKIFYFHVPLAEASLLVFTLAAVFAVLFLIKRKKSYDTRSYVGMETTLVFSVGTMITGVLWTIPSWLSDWTQIVPVMMAEPRLVTYLFMLLLVVAYFVLRNSIDDEERRAVYSSVFAIVAWLSAPITFFITRINPNGQHPVVFQSGMDPSNLIPFILGQLGMLALGFAIYSLRIAEESSREALAVIKDSFEG
ncbi:MAG: cytochrome c biogenesis protein CcsA [Actinomycetes bacterium]|nr:cytochrome c biogenesis protein CcsA [Actinomycetes bacterium]